MQGTTLLQAPPFFKGRGLGWNINTTPQHLQIPNTNYLGQTEGMERYALPPLD